MWVEAAIAVAVMVAAGTVAARLMCNDRCARCGGRLSERWELDGRAVSVCPKCGGE